MPQVSASRYLVTASWDDAPHLDERTKAELLASTPPHLRDARSKGIPSLGSGAIYPIEESAITVAPFAIPPYWKRMYALDVGWRRTAALWLAQDPTDGVRYAYAEYYRAEALPIVHASAIKSRGEWIPGCIDPAARGRSQVDGSQLFALYEELGLNLTAAENAVESGIYDVWTQLETGRLKVFSTLQNWAAERRLYRREEGRIVKKDDHLMDVTRYGTVMFDRIAITKPVEAHGLSGTPKAADQRAGY